MSAFLRGIERRAFVLADLQCGDTERALAAVEHAMRAFVPLSASTPLSGWPAGFWSLLLAQAELSGGQGGVPELAGLGSGPRAALLLRLVAGLDFVHAAQVLGVAEPTYRFALQRALQQLAEADVSYAALGRLRERLHRQVKTLDTGRTDALAAMRARALAGQPAPAAAAGRPASPWLRRLAWGVLVLLALAFAATWWPLHPALAPGAVQALPPETPVPDPVPDTGPAHADAGTVMHPDYAGLAAPGDAGLAEDLPFLSWLAAEGGLEAPPLPEPLPSPPGPAPQDAPRFQDLGAAERPLLAPVAPTWPSLDPDTRRQLLGQARHWLALDAPARAALADRLATWDTLPAPERARRRGAMAAYAALAPAEKARVAALSAAWQALPEEGRADWRARFEALPPEQRESWWLGPSLGPWFSPVQPLFAYLPVGERQALLDILRNLPEPARDDLATLARRLPPAERERLRRALLEAPPEAREALVRERLAQ